LNCSKNLNSKFLYYTLLSKQNFLFSRVRKASVPRLGRDIVENIKISLPSLEEQQRIVDILDRFDTLTNDIKAGLPAEIEARKQQYEYYRDKLLTFKKLEKEGL
ncbi:MAG: restriction endonuclease subunit S, partial [Fusobacteriaceae bacterium]